MSRGFLGNGTEQREWQREGTGRGDNRAMDDEWMIRHKHKNTDTDTRPLLRHATSQERSVDGKRLGKERIKIVSPASCQLLVWPQQPRGALAFGKQARTTCKGQGTGTGDRENIEERLTKIRNGRCVRQADLERACRDATVACTLSLL